METKKNNNSNLDRHKRLFFIFGLIISLSILFFAFNIETKSVKNMEYRSNSQIIETESVPVTMHEPEKPEPKKEVAEKQIVIEEIILTDDPNCTENPELDFEYHENDLIDLSQNALTPDTAETIVYFADTPPVPVGGVIGLRTYISHNIKYPVDAQENGIQGTVYLRFEVKKNGAIGIVQVQKGVDKLLDDEAVRVIKTLPRFTPGKQNGIPVNVWFSIPVVFKLAY